MRGTQSKGGRRGKQAERPKGAEARQGSPWVFWEATLKWVGLLSENQRESRLWLLAELEVGTSYFVRKGKKSIRDLS